MPRTLAASPLLQLARHQLIPDSRFLLLLPDHLMLLGPTLMISNRQDPKEGTECRDTCGRSTSQARPSSCYCGTENTPRVSEQLKAPLPHSKQHPCLQNTLLLSPSPSPSPANGTSHLCGKNVIYIRRDPQTLPRFSSHPLPCVACSVLTFSE